MKYTAALFSAATFLCVSLPAPAAPERSGYIGLAAMDFGYKEFDTNGALLDREDGWLPGIAFGLTETRGAWYGALEGSLYGGEVGYEGRVQSPDPALDGIPIESRTNEVLFDTALLFGYRFATEPLPAAGYGGLGYRYWSRDIQSGRLPDGRPVAGLLEHYRWWYLLAGVKLNLLRNAESLLQMDLRLTRTVGAEMDVDFKGFQNLDDTTLDLGERTGYRVALPWRFGIAPREAISVVPFYEAWDIGRSDPTPATSGGVVQGTVVEPRSETRNWGVSVNYRRSF